MADFGSIIKESWVYKEGGGKKAKTWKKRWLVLYERALRYYVNQNRTEEKGSIELAEVGNTLALEDAYKGRKFVYTVETPLRTFYIQTFSDTEINQWVFCIRDAVDNARVRKAIKGGEVTIKPHPDATWEKLPPQWKMHYNYTLARPYFVDYTTNKPTYNDPRPLPPGWEIRRDEKGFHYFYHNGENVATHTDPRPSIIEPIPGDEPSPSSENNHNNNNNQSSNEPTKEEVKEESNKKEEEKEEEKKEEEKKEEKKEEEKKEEKKEETPGSPVDESN